MRWGDLLIATILLGLCGVVVWQHLDHGTVQKPSGPPPIEVGEALDGSITLNDVGGVERILASWLGEKATVLYSWKVSCPCIDVCEPRLRPIFARYGKAEGVSWIGVDGEPEDGAEEILDKMGRIGACYRMLLDPEQVLVGRLGFDRAALVAVLDAGGRLRYRGSMDDDYKTPTRSYLREALEAVVDGAPLALPQTPPIYGCEFSRPPSCFDPDAERATSQGPLAPPAGVVPGG